MKKINYLILGFLFVSLIYAGCSKIENAADVEFDADYNTNLFADVPASGQKAAFVAESKIDPLENDDVSKYINQIKNIEIQKITAEVVEINKEATLVSGNLDIYTSSNKASWNLDNLPLTKGAVLELNNTEGQWNTVKQIFAEKTSFDVKLTGNTNQGDLMFTLKVSIETKVTANPL